MPHFLISPSPRRLHPGVLLLVSGLTLPALAQQGLPARTAQGSQTLPLTVKDARVIAVPPGIRETTLVATLTNAGAQPVVISQASSSVAGMTMLMTTVKQNNLIGMKTVPTLTVPARGTLRLNESGDHIMFMQLKRPLKIGELLKVTLNSRDGRSLTFQAVVKKPG